MAPNHSPDRELFDKLMAIAAEHAASTLHEMIGQKIELSIGSVNLLPNDAAISVLANNLGRRLALVKQPLSGALTGTAAFALADEQSTNLVSMLIDQDPPVEDRGELDVTGLEAEAIAELGNILLNSSVKALANHLSAQIETGLPVVDRGTPISVTRQVSHNNQELILSRISLRSNGANIDGHILLALDAASMTKLLSPHHSHASELA